MGESKEGIEGKYLHEELGDGLGTLTPWIFAIGGLIWILDRKAQKLRLEDHVYSTAWR